MSKITVPDKVIYKKNTLYEINIKEGMAFTVSEGSKIKAGSVIAQKSVKSNEDQISVEGYMTKVSKGDEVSEGDVLAIKGKFLKKKIISGVNGIVKEIVDDVIYINVEDGSGQEEVEDTESPFDSEVVKIAGKSTLLQFPAVELNLFESKGDSVVGHLKYISSSTIKEDNRLSKDIEGAIVVTDQITYELYPLVSAVGAKGIIANSVDYELFRDMIILAVPIGIISGFGSDLQEDKKLVKWFKANEGKIIWFDGICRRFIIPAKTEPKWLKTYQFEISL